MKKGIVLVIMVGVLSLIIYLFWIEEYRHLIQNKNSMPAYYLEKSPVIRQYGISINDRPIFIHFYNPSCKYSKVNIEHLKGVFQSYTEQIDFYLVVTGQQVTNGNYLKEKYQLPSSMKVIMDPDGQLSRLCGVNSTPRAVLFDTDSTRYFDGNYTSGFTFCGPANIKNSAPAVALEFKSKGYQAPLVPVVSGFGCEL
ncbi:hypothetical protein SAMN04488028_101879 [Reichenbachiella agariperforans]|uniref:AhpC/TSA family protein n=1 Tax=Reichenbachiella agariperforans TaxID=156994 RepID=A0A1M6L9V0_REIAG|nr:hypothetical protein [Reichenbachiella agariperforans]SHJ67925.1 hypothetical protein SAMN04488028_101879 [Reichenbachiella agariperforans]